jgi:large subunit ribosomal protein L31
MKASLHPSWNPDAKVVCACGNTFTTGSTLPEIRVEICSACHPFFTGTQKFVDTLGQVDRFIKKTESSKVKQLERQKILEARQTRVQKKQGDKPSLKDLLMQARKQVSS